MGEAEYELARRVTSIMRTEISERRARWTEAVSFLTKGLLNGAVSSALQSVKGGKFSEPLPTTDWIVHDPEVLLWRFALCSLDEAKRFDVTPYSPDTHKLIYVSADSLRTFQAGPLAELFGKPPVVVSGTTAPVPHTPGSPVEESRPAALADLKKMLNRAILYMKERGHSELTREEAENSLLPLIYPNNPRSPIREVVAALIPIRKTRRPERQLHNRDKELDDCRRFLETAT